MCSLQKGWPSEGGYKWHKLPHRHRRFGNQAATIPALSCWASDGTVVEQVIIERGGWFETRTNRHCAESDQSVAQKEGANCKVVGYRSICDLGAEARLSQPREGFQLSRGLIRVEVGWEKRY